MRRRNALLAMAGMALPLAASSSCRRGDAKGGPLAGKKTLVVKYQPMGEPQTFQALLRTFETSHPDVRVVAELLPNSADVTHQFFLTALEGGSNEFDLFVVDIVWVSEFAHAGWLLDLSNAFPPSTVRREFLPGVADAVIVDGKTFAVPWYVDTGVFYYRTDLVSRPPKTYEELVRLAEIARRDHRELAGFVWQGRQYEGLVCNVYEAIWGHGGETTDGGRILIDVEAARAALSYLRALVARGISPSSVTSAAEEETRRMFQSGRAVFMRNWPYAWSEAEREGSPVRGKVGIAPLPSITGEPAPGVLGGYQLAINRHVAPAKREHALALLSHLTSPEASVAIALAYGRSPARRISYDDPRIQKGAPLIAALGPAFERARPRPVTPYYAMISDFLQGEFSAAVAGVRTPADALARAQVQVDRLMEAR